MGVLSKVTRFFLLSLLYMGCLAAIYAALYPKEVMVYAVRWQIQRSFVRSFGIVFQPKNCHWENGTIVFQGGEISKGESYFATFDSAYFTPTFSLKKRILGGKLAIDALNVQRFSYEPLPLLKRPQKKHSFYTLDLEVTVSEAQLQRGEQGQVRLDLEQKISGSSYQGCLSLNWKEKTPKMLTTFSYDAPRDQHMFATHLNGHTIEDFYQTFETFFPKNFPNFLAGWKAQGGALFGSLQATFVGGELRRVVSDLDLEGFQGENSIKEMSLGASRLGVHLILDFSANEPLSDWQGEISIQGGCLTLGRLKQSEWEIHWDFENINSSIFIERGMVQPSILAGTFLGMKGELEIFPKGLDGEIVSLNFSGSGKEIGKHIPSGVGENFCRNFGNDPFYLRAKLSEGHEGMRMEGVLEHRSDSPCMLDFGCQFGSCGSLEALPFEGSVNQQFSSFIGTLQQQLGLSDKRLGWFKAHGVPLERYFSPFVFEKTPFSMAGNVDLEGSFDERHVVLFYKGRKVVFQGRDFALELDEIEEDALTHLAAVHYFDLSSGKNLGFLPLNQATYVYRKKNLIFPNCRGVVHFDSGEIRIKEFQTRYKDLEFGGEALFKKEKEGNFHAYYNVPKISGSLKTAHELTDMVFGDIWLPAFLEGSVNTAGKGAQFHYTFDTKKANLVESMLEGEFAVSGEAGECTLTNGKGAFTFCYPSKKIAISGVHAEILSQAGKHQIEIPQMTFGQDIEGSFFVYKDHVQVANLIGKMDQDLLSLTGKIFNDEVKILGERHGNQVSFEKARFGQWESTAQVSKCGTTFKMENCSLIHPTLGQLSCRGTYDLVKQRMLAEMTDLSIHLEALFDSNAPLWRIQGDLNGKGSVVWDKNLNSSLIVSHNNLAINGLRFADGDPIECQFIQNRGVTIKGLKALVPLKESEESYELGQFHWDPYRERFFFDRLHFSLPKERTPWLQEVYARLVGQELDPKLCQLLFSLKEDEPLRGAVSAEYSHQKLKVFLGLEDGTYYFHHKPYDLKRLQLCCSQQGLSLQGECHKLAMPLFFKVVSQTDLAGGEIYLGDQWTSDAYTLQANWVRSPDQGFSFTKIEGELLGAHVALFLSEKESSFHRYQGDVSFNFERVGEYLGEHQKLLSDQLALGGEYRFEGEWSLDPKGELNPHFVGTVHGKQCQVCAISLDQISAFTQISPDHVEIEALTVQDWSGDLTVPYLLFKKNDQAWYFEMDQLLLTNFRLSRLNSPWINPKRQRPLCRSIYIPHLELNHFHGDLSNPKTYKGEGKILFTNYTRKSMLTNLLMVPAEISARIGLDLTNFIPARGKIHYVVKDEKCTIHLLEEVYSEGKRSRFYLDESGYIDFDGNLSLNVKMKQYNLLMKLAELFTISVEGTLFDPVYAFSPTYEKISDSNAP